MRLLFSVFLTLALAPSATSADLTHIALLSIGGISKSFQQTVKLPALQAYEKIVYGNDSYGFFEVAKERIKPQSISLIPPGYRLPISIFGVTANGRKKLLKKASFSPPDLSLIEEYFQVERQADFRSEANFLLLSGSLPRVSEFQIDDVNGLQYALILNRLGEIIWVHIPSYGQRKIQTPLTLQAKGKKVFLYATQRDSRLEAVDNLGQLSSVIDGEQTPIPFVIADSLIVDEEEQIFAISHKKGFIRNIKKPLKSPDALLGSTLVAFNKERKIPEVRHDSFKAFNPYTNAQKEHKNKPAFYNWKEKPPKSSLIEYRSLQIRGNHGVVCLPRRNEILWLDLASGVIAKKYSLQPFLSKEDRLISFAFTSDHEILFLAIREGHSAIYGKIDLTSSRLLFKGHSVGRPASGSINTADSADGKAWVFINEVSSGSLLNINEQGKILGQWTIKGIGKSPRISLSESLWGDEVYTGTQKTL